MIGFVVFVWAATLLVAGCLGFIMGDSCGSNIERKATLNFLIQNKEKISNNFRKYLSEEKA